MYTCRALTLLAFLLVAPITANAAFSITEIMYDAPGTDAKHEWIEIHNSSQAINLSSYKLFEDGTNHALTLHSGGSTVSAGGYAIIADDAATFRTDFPAYSGPLFDSTFSLSNAGETIALRDSALADVATASYGGEQGGDGDGESLHFVSGAWSARPATPGAGAGVAVTTPSAVIETVYVEEEVPRITVDAGPDKVIVVGAGSVFSATAFGVKGEPLSSARYVWNFGNAASKEGKAVMYAYPIPGVYVVTVDATNAGFAATDRVIVTVASADLVVTRANQDYIELENRTGYELDLGLWQLGVGKDLFVFPAHSVFPPGRAIAFPVSATGLKPESARDVVLYYPNGVRAAGPAPETTFVSDAPIVQRPQVLGAAKVEDVATTTYAKELTAAIGNTTPTWAWVSFALVALMIAAGFGGLLYLGRKP